MTTATWERPTRQPRPPRVDPAWRKAPGVLARSPVLLCALVGAAAVLGLAAASGPLFLVSAEHATRGAELAALDPADAGLVVAVPVSAEPEAFAAIDEAVTAEVAADLAELGEAVRATRTVPVTLEARGGETRVRLVGVADPPAEGVAVPATVADDLDLAPGDALEFVRTGRRSGAAVGAVTFHATDGEFPELVSDSDTVAGLAAELGAGMEATWTFPLERPPPDLDRLAARIAAVARRIEEPASDAGAAIAAHAEYRTRVETSSGLPALSGRTAEAAAALAPPVRSLWVAATLAGLVVVVGAGALRARRRRLEHTLEATRGITPLAQATRAAVEAVLPLAAGAGLGLAAAAGAVATLGPGGLVDAALPAAGVAVAVAALLAVGLIAATTAALLRGGHVVAGRGRAVLSRVPWELAPLALAALAYTRFDVAEAARGPGVDPLVLAFPVLALLGGMGVAARGLASALPYLRRAGEGARTPTLLVLRRLAAAPAATVSLIAVTGLAVGLLVAAATLAASARETAEAKAAVSVGAGAAASVLELMPEEPVAGTTVVGRGEARIEPGGQRVDLLAVHAEAFADVAAWRSAFADRPLEALLGALTAPAGPAVPLIVVGDLGADPLRLHGPGFVVPVTAAGAADAFPGQGTARPLLVLDRDVVAEAVAAADGRPLEAALRPEVWALGTAAEATARAVEAGAAPGDVRTAEQVADSAALRASRWTLGYLQGVAAGAGLLAALAVVLILTERQRAREVGYALARRMGLGRAAHRRSVAGELGALLALAVVLGAGMGLAVAALAVPAVDPLPARPPEPWVAVPWPALGAVAAGAAAVLAAGAALVQRAADRTRVAEVLRANE